jgi:hypothetical protein
MVNKLIYTLSILFSILLSSSLVQAQKLGFQQVLEKSPSDPTTFCIPQTENNIAALRKEDILIKYSTRDWLFVTATPQWIQNAKKDRVISDFFFEFAPPKLLADTARVAHYVNQVHDGVGGLQTPFTGKDVIIGYVDTGLEFTHEDFKNDDGSTRVLRYWDHTVATGPSPGTYGYGTVWDSTAINNGTCTSTDSHSHGTTVAGFGSGNARANGRMKGMAPESDIIIVESNFNATNWTLTIADACDYIFKVADTLGKPAIVNLSLGTYFGSHDGNDPTSEAMEAMLDEKPGRVIIAAAGNSGLSGKNHVHNIVTLDTSFVWFKNNPSGNFGPNTIYFDLWSDTLDATYDFGFAADRPSPDYDLRGTTIFHSTTDSIGSVIYDTIWNNGNQIATIESYPSIVGPNYNLQVLFTIVDSTSYLYRFMTTNSGEYDIWSGSWHGFNDMETTLPTVVQMPAIAHYVLPDTLQSIVSSWNCSEKVISVGNVQNRLGHIDGNGNQYLTPGLNPPGKLALKSSKGPSRHNIMKPDISASGEVSLAAAPSWGVNFPQAYAVLDSGLLHMRNSGTSMSSPLVAGVAALYLEKCNNATYNDFKTDMIATAFSDGFTGTLPNFGYGHGKIHALDLLLETNFTASIVGPDGICDEPITLEFASTEPITTATWSDGSNAFPLSTSTPNDYSAIVYDARGCISYTDTHTVVQYLVPTIGPITQIGDTLFATSTINDYQWTLDGNDLNGETTPQLTVNAPFGTYTCYTVSADGCIAETNSVVLTVGLESIALDEFSIYPNPVRDFFQIKSKSQILQVELIDAAGRKTSLNDNPGLGYDVSSLSSGLYTIIVTTESGVFQSKITRM